MDSYREEKFVVGSRVEVEGKGTGIIAMDNEDGTWNVELDDSFDCDVAASQLTLCSDQCIDELRSHIHGWPNDIRSGIEIIDPFSPKEKPKVASGGGAEIESYQTSLQDLKLELQKRNGIINQLVEAAEMGMKKKEETVSAWKNGFWEKNAKLLRVTEDLEKQKAKNERISVDFQDLKNQKEAKLMTLEKEIEGIEEFNDSLRQELWEKNTKLVELEEEKKMMEDSNAELWGKNAELFEKNAELLNSLKEEQWEKNAELWRMEEAMNQAQSERDEMLQKFEEDKKRWNLDAKFVTKNVNAMDLKSLIDFRETLKDLTSRVERRIIEEQDMRDNCAVCYASRKEVAFGCGHQVCSECSQALSVCHICRKNIDIRITLYH